METHAAKISDTLQLETKINEPCFSVPLNFKVQESTYSEPAPIPDLAMGPVEQGLSLTHLALLRFQYHLRQCVPSHFPYIPER